MAAETTSTLSHQVATYYEKSFLKRAMYEFIYDQGAQKRRQSANEGKVIKFNRFTPLSVITNTLSEGTNPTEVSLTGTTVSCTLAEYGSTVKISRFLTLTSIDANNKEKIDVIGQNMGESLDQLVRTELENGTAQLAGGKAAVTDIAATDVLSASEVRKTVRTLEAAKAMTYPDGLYIGKVQPYTKADLLNDSTWINAKTYSDVKDLYRGEMGELYQVRFLLSKNGKTTASTATVYHNYIHGANAFGTYDLAGDPPKLYIIPHTQVDSGNAAGRFSLASWAGSYVAKVLVTDWIYVLKTGATA
jgi:N4-gp56 family major capsid protein